MTHQPPTDPIPQAPGPQTPAYNPLAGDPPPEPASYAIPMPAQPRRRRSPWPWVIGSVAAVMLLCVGIGVIAAATADPPKTEPGFGEVAADTRPATTPPKPAAAPTTPAMVYGKPDPGEFKLTIKTLKKECFGSAGCVVTYRIDPTYTGTLPLDPSKTYRVTYEVRGVEDGPAVNNFTVTGDTASMESEELAQTPSKSTKLTAKATEVIEE